MIARQAYDYLPAFKQDASAGAATTDQYLMEDPSFDIEEELDPSLLGLWSDQPDASCKEGEVDGSISSEQHKQGRSTTAGPSSSSRTALDLLESIAGSYASADWHPSALSADLAPKSLEDIYPGILASPTAQGPVLDEHVPVVRDFADDSQSAKQVSVGAPVGGSDMEKTASCVSTASSVERDPLVSPLRNHRPRVTWVRTRLPGRRRYRTGIRVHRQPNQSDQVETDVDTDASMDTNTTASIPSALDRSITAPSSDPSTPFQRDFSNTFGHEALDKLDHSAKLDSTAGNLLPPVIRDLFPALADTTSALKIANVIRRQLELPLLNYAIASKAEKIALRRALAKMREIVYMEIMAAFTLPLAPKATETDDEGEVPKEKSAVANVRLTPSALKAMAQRLPLVFPAEKALLKAFLADECKLAYGEQQGQVVWQGGVGRVRGKGEAGFRGVRDTDGLCHIYVDHSNILHGLLHHLYANPSDALPPRHLRTLSLPALSLLLRRGRPTPPGSLHLVASSPLHQNLDPLVRLGWEVSVLKRVELYEDEVTDPTSMKVNARAQSRISGHGDVGLRRYREQGVDEILHLKILQVLNQKGVSVDKSSGTPTLVLATGDARGGQFNLDGFPGAVREALKRGWNVELWSFTAGLSRAWKETARRERWHELGKFTIWALDDWAEQLVEVGEED
ncbi:hypothetical protein IAU60_002509 [Kwoniella sp. DSM 27419]